MGFTSGRQVACEILTSSGCPTSCRYCFLPKVTSLKEFLPKIKKKVDSGEYIEELEKLYGDKLEHLSFWGLEPLTTLSYFHAITQVAIDKFPRLKHIGFSTNMFLDPKIIVNFVKCLPKDKDFNFDIQISIDGPPEITDGNRGENATKKIKTNFYDLLIMLNDIDLGKLNISFSFKPTIDIGNIDWFLGSVSRLYGYFIFFDMLIDGAYLHNKNKNVQLKLNGIPTLAVPGFYTTTDGTKLSKFFNMLHDIECDNSSRDLFFHIKGCLNAYEERFMRDLRFGSEYNEKAGMFTCSGGDSNFQLDCDGNVHLCHRTLFYESKEFIDALISNEFIHGREEAVSNGMIGNVKKKWIVNNKDQAEINRFLYITGNYHNWAFTRSHLSLGIIYELASSGQISKVFLDEEMASWFAVFVHTALSCPAENLLSNGSIYIPPLSNFRMFGNGAFESIFKYAVKRAGKEHIR